MARLRNDNRRLANRIEHHAPPPLANPLLRPAARHSDIRPARPTSEYARPVAPRGLDGSGRSPAARSFVEEKILDIPAFLGRKAY